MGAEKSQALLSFVLLKLSEVSHVEKVFLSQFASFQSKHGQCDSNSFLSKTRKKATQQDSCRTLAHQSFRLFPQKIWRHDRDRCMQLLCERPSFLLFWPLLFISNNLKKSAQSARSARSAFYSSNCAIRSTISRSTATSLSGRRSASGCGMSESIQPRSLSSWAALCL